MSMIAPEALGICRGCSEVVSAADTPADAIDADWHCPHCKALLTHESFGYATAAGERVRWVGPDGKWTEEKPERDFELGPWYVTAGPVRHQAFW